MKLRNNNFIMSSSSPANATQQDCGKTVTVVEKMHGATDGGILGSAQV